MVLKQIILKSREEMKYVQVYGLGALILIK